MNYTHIKPGDNFKSGFIDIELGSAEIENKLYDFYLREEIEKEGNERLVARYGNKLQEYKTVSIKVIEKYLKNNEKFENIHIFENCYNLAKSMGMI